MSVILSKVDDSAVSDKPRKSWLECVNSWFEKRDGTG